MREVFRLGPRSFNDHQSLLYDLVAPLAIDAVPFLLAAAADNPAFVANAHPDTPAGIDMLAEWNYLADARSEAMTFFHVWWTAFQAASPVLLSTADGLMELIREDTEDGRLAALLAASDAAKLMRNQ